MARVMDDEAIPQVVDLLVGTTIQRKLRMVMDIENQRVELRAISEVARLESLEVIENRMLCRPIKVLDLCAGVSGTYCTLSDLGFTIEQWHAVEADTLTSAVAERAFSSVETIATDVMDFSPQQEYDVVLAGPPCQPWSRAPGEARGFGDPRSDIFRQCARITGEDPGTPVTNLFCCQQNLLLGRP